MTIKFGGRSPVQVLALLLCLIGTAESTAAQAEIFSTGNTGGRNWCKDSGTFCWNDGGTAFSGLRIVGEPKFGTVFAGGENRVDSEGFGKLAVLGLESNVVGSLLSLQVSIITPGRVTLDDQSPLRAGDRLVNPEGEIDVDGGVALGLSLFDGILTFGLGMLRFDPRDIRSPSTSEKRTNYGYLNLQAVSAVRAFVKQGK